MSPLARFLVFKLGLALALIAFAVREFILAGRPDSNPEYTRKLVRVFSAAKQTRRRVTAPSASRPSAAPEPAASRRAA